MWERGKASKPSERHFCFLSLECFLETSLLAHGSWGEGEVSGSRRLSPCPFFSAMSECPNKDLATGVCPARVWVEIIHPRTGEKIIFQEM